MNSSQAFLMDVSDDAVNVVVPSSIEVVDMLNPTQSNENPTLKMNDIVGRIDRMIELETERNKIMMEKNKLSADRNILLKNYEIAIKEKNIILLKKNQLDEERNELIRKLLEK